MHQRIAPGLDRRFDELQAGLAEALAAFLNVAFRAGADNIRPDRFAAQPARNNMVKRQLAGREFAAAILTAVSVAGKDVAAVEFDLAAGKTVVK